MTLYFTKPYLLLIFDRRRLLFFSGGAREFFHLYVSEKRLGTFHIPARSPIPISVNFKLSLESPHTNHPLLLLLVKCSRGIIVRIPFLNGRLALLGGFASEGRATSFRSLTDVFLTRTINSLYIDFYATLQEDDRISVQYALRFPRQ